MLDLTFSNNFQIFNKCINAIFHLYVDKLLCYIECTIQCSSINILYSTCNSVLYIYYGKILYKSKLSNLQTEASWYSYAENHSNDCDYCKFFKKIIKMVFK